MTCRDLFDYLCSRECHYTRTDAITLDVVDSFDVTPRDARFGRDEDGRELANITLSPRGILCYDTDDLWRATM